MQSFEVFVEGIRAIIETHFRPHLDELTAIWLIERYGNQGFVKQYAEDGVIKLGIDGGPLDEHPDPEKGDRKEGESACSLVAKALSLTGPAMSFLVQQVTRQDSSGSSSSLELGFIVEVMYHNDKTAEQVMEFVFGVLDDLYRYQYKLQTTTAQEYKRLAQFEEIPTHRGPLKMVVLDGTNNPQLSKYARSKAGGYVAIVIQRQPTGNVQIFTNQFYNIDLSGIARTIQQKELLALGQSPSEVGLGSEGMIANWYYHSKMQALLNGSLKHPEVPPTKLSLEKLRDIIRQNLKI